MHSTASAAHVFHHDDPVAVATAVPTDVMPPNEGVGVDVADDAAKPEGNKKRRWHIWAWLLGLGAAVVATVAIVLIRQGHARRVARGSMDVNVPSVAPTDVGPEECRKKRVKIAEVCGLPDLDEGGTMEVKVTVNDLPYWPRTGRAESDCLEGYGRGGEDSCVVPDSSLLECFPLRNAPELPFGPGGASIEERLKVTISDVDFFWNDEIEIYAPSAEWHRPNLCEKREFQFAQPSGSATIKMVVDFGEVEDPCGVEEEALTSGLEDAADALEGVRLGLVEYVRGADPSRRRRLIFPLLASGFRLMAGAVSTGGRSFVKLFTRGSRAGNALSTVADMSEVGSLLFSIFGNDDRESSTPRYNNNEALFDEVFDRFDQIDSHLDGIQAQIKDGFEEIKLVIEEEFAQQELDDWITFRLNINLRGDYQVSGAFTFVTARIFCCRQADKYHNYLVLLVVLQGLHG
ncbi:hypothetical protein ACHAWF_017391 [Thalassiosira exigua]